MLGKRTKKAENFGKSHVKKNDNVVVLAGKDRGKRGKVLRVIPTKGTAIVERVNFLKKHTKKNPQKNMQGGIVERESPLRVSNLMVICPSCDEPTRVASKHSEEATIRACKKCDADLAR